MLEIKNLHVRIEGKPILKGVNLHVPTGKRHAIMGLNGSGKSTLAQVIAGNSAYEVEKGEIIFNGKSLFEMSPEQRAQEGVFVAFQNPIDLPGVNNAFFLKAAVNAVRKYRGLPSYDAADFLMVVREKMVDLAIEDGFLERQVNVGFSGGERKKNEVLQMLLLDPKLVILDETDSGLDVDALRIVAEGVNRAHNKEKSALCITHYNRLLDILQPDLIYVLHQGCIAHSGTMELADQIEKNGYASVL